MTAERTATKIHMLVSFTGKSKNKQPESFDHTQHCLQQTKKWDFEHKSPAPLYLFWFEQQSKQSSVNDGFTFPPNIIKF